MTVGTRKPPSQFVAFSPRKGVLTAVWPGHHLGAVIRGVDDNGVIRDAQIIQLLEQLANHAVVLHHTVGFQSKDGLALRVGLEVRPDMHSGRVEPAEKRLARLVLAIHEIKRSCQKFLIHRFHALNRELSWGSPNLPSKFSV
jgi:hypothetical protein